MCVDVEALAALPSARGKDACVFVCVDVVGDRGFLHGWRRDHLFVCVYGGVRSSFPS